MVIYLPGKTASDTPALDELTPREIVGQLDKYVVGQTEAKRAVAAGQGCCGALQRPRRLA